jgi:hypothetical protein
LWKAQERWALHYNKILGFEVLTALVVCIILTRKHGKYSAFLYTGQKLSLVVGSYALTFEVWQLLSYKAIKDVMCCPVKVPLCTFQNQMLCAPR